MANRVESSTRHYDERLQLILKASAKIFAEKGFHRTSIRDIARATGMSLAGLYYYVRTKEELLFLIQEQCFMTLLQRWEKTADPQEDVRTRIRRFAERQSTAKRGRGRIGSPRAAQLFKMTEGCLGSERSLRSAAPSTNARCGIEDSATGTLASCPISKTEPPWHLYRI